MSKYKPLSDALGRQPGDEYAPTFAELEEVLGFPLPKAARTGKGWWASDADKAQAKAWAAHGWEVGDVDHAAERVVFRRGAASAIAMQAAADHPPTAEPAPGAAAAAPASPEAADQSAAPGTALVPTVAPAKAVTPRKLGLAAAIAGGAAVAAGLAALAIREVMKPKKQPPFPPRRRWK